ncbi:protein TIC 22-like, chloroplastic [Dioscorea cayenensis subsp. rotundata]|uniref:Protein TIC 22-like, chloroplastic n=1 Tax=Dioscorea cayennensis subsp. rotundata TaxID=55577 RepID=A0AB40CGJ8_DIOCR|nr:protein TIC 22-like, chloroplastic [Dioscorea cayenensis subsp. rotundata]
MDNPFSSLKAHLQSTLHDLRSRAQHAFHSSIARFTPHSTLNNLPLARISFAVPRKDSFIEERLAGVPVYALSNSAGEFVLMSSAGSGKSLGLFCFREEDAAALLDQMRSMNSDMKQGSKVVAVALNKVVQLKVDGVAFRFIPDSSQVANAIKEKGKIGESVDSFPGVPVFQSRSLVLKSQNKRYRPVFFRMEDLDDSLYRASHEQSRLNPALRRGDLQVAVLEDIVGELKGNSASEWDDVVFVPPGLKLSSDLTQETPTATK